MPAFQFSSQNLSNLLASNQAVNAQNATQPSQTIANNGAKNQFSSLLDIVGVADDVVQKLPSLKSAGEYKVDEKSSDKVNSADNNNAPDASKKPLQTRAEKDQSPVKAKKNDVRVVGNQHYLTRKTSKTNDTAKTAEQKKPASKENDIIEAVTNSDNVDNKISAQHLHLSLNLLTKIDDFFAINVNGQQSVSSIHIEQQTNINIDINTNSELQANTNSSNNLLRLISPENVFSNLQKDLAGLKQNLEAVSNPNTIYVNGSRQETIDQIARINADLARDLQDLKALNNLADFQQNLGGVPENLALKTQVASEGFAITDNKSGDGLLNYNKNLRDILDQTLQKFSNIPQLTKADTALVKDLLAKFNAQNADAAGKIDSVDSKKNPVGDFINTVQNAAQNVDLLNKNITTNIVANNVSTSPLVAATENNSGSFSQNNSGGQNSNSQGQFSVGASSATSAAQTSGEVNKPNFSNMLSRTTPSNQANQANVAEQVVFQVKTTLKTGDSKISIQLHPEDLGKVDIAMEVGANGKTSVHITADNKQTLDLLQSDSKGLQKALADAGLKADSGSLSFNLRGGQGDGSGGNQGQNQAQAASNYRKSYLEEEPILPTIATVTHSYTVKMPDGLDINV